MNLTNKLLLDMLKLGAAMKGDEDSYQDLWILAVAAQSFDEIEKSSPLLAYKEDDESRRSDGDVCLPTHIVRMVLKRKQSNLVNVIDIYVNLPQETGTVDLVWEDVWDGEGPGEIQAALRWVSQLAEPFYVQLDNPFRSAKIP
ncbi:hypothetical protein PMI08_01077 [Brevibacillus sp. CF112]|uniref:hypothetical protein n=1 Tax=Brevibacillus TaxID=55080 RepID=UPI0002716560|nr:hypothetical protein [Brevibacillus sp. CF112]EJL46582.1 hypothetical protein PMI08_01077 [Brevibacillus sp. CF112]